MHKVNITIFFLLLLNSPNLIFFAHSKMNQIEIKSLCQIQLGNHFPSWALSNVHFSAIEQILKHLFREQDKMKITKSKERERERLQCVWHDVFFVVSLKIFHPLTIFHFDGRRSIFFLELLAHTYRLLKSVNR